MSGFTFQYCKLLVDRLFQYSFHDNTISTVCDAKTAIQKVLTHYMPDDEDHSRCYYLEYDWCKTAQSIYLHKRNTNSINKCSALKSPLPIGIRKVFTEWLYSNTLSESAIRILLKPPCSG
eukprot:898003_1